MMHWCKYFSNLLVVLLRLVPFNANPITIPIMIKAKPINIKTIIIGTLSNCKGFPLDGDGVDAPRIFSSA